MTVNRRRLGAFRGIALLVAAAVLLPTLPGCGGSEKPELGAADGTYTVRGIVSALPTAPGGEVSIHHESIHDFVNRQGEKVEMESMTMPFAADEKLLEGVRQGDKVEITFEVRWSGQPALLLTDLDKLPPDTQLQLGAPTLEPVAGFGGNGSTQEQQERRERRNKKKKRQQERRKKRRQRQQQQQQQQQGQQGGTAQATPTGSR